MRLWCHQGSRRCQTRTPAHAAHGEAYGRACQRGFYAVAVAMAISMGAVMMCTTGQPDYMPCASHHPYHISDSDVLGNAGRTRAGAGFLPDRWSRRMHWCASTRIASVLGRMFRIAQLRALLLPRCAVRHI